MMVYTPLSIIPLLLLPFTKASIPLIETKTGSILYNPSIGKKISSSKTPIFSIIGTSPFLPSSTTTITADDSDDVVTVTCPSISLSDQSSTESVTSVGVNTPCIVMTGMTSFDSIRSSRFGKMIHAVLSQALKKDPLKKICLVVTVEGDGDKDKIRDDVVEIWEACVLGMGRGDVDKGLLEVLVVDLNSEEDAQSVLAMAKEKAASMISPEEEEEDTNILSTITDTYSKLKQTPATPNHPPAISETILLCQDAYARHARTSRAKLLSWKNRVSRGLTVDKYGSQAESLLKRTIASYDRDTIAAAGTSVSSYRLELRQKLYNDIVQNLRNLFFNQLSNVEKRTIQKFEGRLLRTQKRKSQTQDLEYTDHASAIRAAVFTFDQILTDLEIPSQSLTKDTHSQAINTKLHATLSNFQETPAAQLTSIQQVQKRAGKSRKPKEAAFQFGLNLVAMLRPDGFGNFQGFCGYSLPGTNHGLIVGCHNDADAPETISQFGGVRPPLLRIQPKLNLDVEF